MKYMIKFQNYEFVKPENGSWCIVKGLFKNKKEIMPSYFMCYWEEESAFAVHRITKWAPVPKHVCVDPTGWKSEYYGDELPNNSDWCLVCTEKNKHVHFAWFDEKTQDFPEHKQQVIAFMEL